MINNNQDICSYLLINMVKYSYRLSKEMKNESFNIYAYYSKKPKNCIILDFVSKNNEIIIIDACKEFFKSIKFQSSWMHYINSSNLTISLQSIFKSVKVIDNRIECLLDFSYLFKSYKQF